MGPHNKVKKLEIFQSKNGSSNCIWSRLNAQGTQVLLSFPYQVLGDYPFLFISTAVEQIKVLGG